MRDMLREAFERSEQACCYMEDEGRNAAIGSISDLGDLLHDAKALYDASLILHRQ